VTEYDTKIQDLIYQTIKAAFPDDLFIGEESVTEYTLEQVKGSRCWVVDPVDGTTNFVHSIPYCCVSIGFIVNGRPVVGVVHNPNLNELHYAVKGKGAFLNGVPIEKISRPFDSLNRALVGTEYGSDRSPTILSSKLTSIQNFVTSSQGIRGIRCFGSSALATCYVARGILDVFYEAGIHVWDICAAAIILEESGGRVFNWDNGNDNYDLDLFCRKFVAVRSVGSETELNKTMKMIRSYLEPIEMTRELQ
jgi:fructose-1,6-bisphosphatase/inositol monophosphatase family enzyme